MVLHRCCDVSQAAIMVNHDQRGCDENHGTKETANRGGLERTHPHSSRTTRGLLGRRDSDEPPAAAAVPLRWPSEAKTTEHHHDSSQTYVSAAWRLLRRPRRRFSMPSTSDSR